MTLRDADTRRALRAVIEALVVLALLALVWAFAGRLTSHQLAGILHAALIIVGMGTLFYGAENVTRAVRFKAGVGGVEGSIGDDAPEAAQHVADAAQEQADAIKGNAA